MSNNSQFLPKGTILNGQAFQYRIESVLGFGGFGITYKVSTETKVSGVMRTEHFAVKEYFVKGCCGRSENSCEMIYTQALAKEVVDGKLDFISEARRLISLKHRNIMRVYEAFEANNTAYYVMDYVEGVTLRETILGNGSMNIHEVLQWVPQVLDAVNYLHKRHITHLDIKPGNIMMKTGERKGVYPVLIDFGQSKHYDDNDRATSTIRVRGCTDGYAPIEQYASIDIFNPQADIYAIGASIVFCLTAKTPPRAIDLEVEQLEQLFPSSFDYQFLNILKRAMAAKRAERTVSAAKLMHEIHNWRKLVSVSPQPDGTKPSPPSEKLPIVKKTYEPQPIPSYDTSELDRQDNHVKWIWVIVFAIIVLILSAFIVINKLNKKAQHNNNLNQTAQIELFFEANSPYIDTQKTV